MYYDFTKYPEEEYPTCPECNTPLDDDRYCENCVIFPGF